MATLWYWTNDRKRKFISQVYLPFISQHIQVGEAAAFVRSTDPELFPADDASPPYEDSTSGPGAPDLELFVSPLAYANHGLGKIPYGHLWSLHATLLRSVNFMSGFISGN